MFAWFIFALLFVSAASAQQDNSAQFKNIGLSPSTRARDLIRRMTLDEKIAQMQNAAPAIPRLAIPAYDWWNEALHGVARAGLATVFPQAIGLAATWDTGLERSIAEAISTEARAKFNDAIRFNNRERYFGLTFWSPNINIFRDPRWGRGQETFGEDPFLTARMAIAFVRGMQGSDPHYLKTVATVKHFAVHSGPESSRHRFDAQVSQQDLDDTYLYAFRASIEEGAAYSVMCAYNRVNGEAACASPSLLQNRLRGKWQFKGYVVSDCGAIDDIYKGHALDKTAAQASAAAVKAGTDLECGNSYRTLADAVHEDLISESEIDASLERLFVARFRLGLFDPPANVLFSKIQMSEVASKAHRDLTLEAAQESIVLLKNSGNILPLQAGAKKLAVIGPAANDPDALLANYNGIPPQIVTPWEGLQQRFGAANTRYALGSLYTAESTAFLPASLITTGSQPGLLAEYFATPTFSAAPALSRVEGKGYFRWDMQDAAVTAKIPRTSFALRWSGTLKVQATGDYGLGFTRLPCPDCSGSDSARLYIDNREVLAHNKPTQWDLVSEISPVHLEAGRAYQFRAEYLQNGGAAGIELIWKPPPDIAMREALNLIDSSDAAILFVGLNSSLEGEESKIEIPGFAGGDRTTIALPEAQQSLLTAVLATGKPVIVVLINGSALGIKEAKQRANAILEAWYPGQAGGTAIAATLAGDYNPAGRLPVTFYESIDQLPPFDNYDMAGRTYRYFLGKPLFPFGYGLSYSEFAYTDLALSRGDISVRVTNRSQRDGDEVAQLYATATGIPNAQLRGFQRIHLKAGASQVIHFHLFTEDANRLGQHGTISVGGGQPLREWTRNFIQINVNSRDFGATGR